MRAAALFVLIVVAVAALLAVYAFDETDSGLPSAIPRDDAPAPAAASLEGRSDEPRSSDAAAEATWIDLRVMDETTGAAIEGAHVEACALDRVRRATLVTGTDGRVRFPGAAVPWTAVRATRTPPGAGGAASCGAVLSGAGPHVVAFGGPPAPLRGRIVCEDGSPVPDGVTVRIAPFMRSNGEALEFTSYPLAAGGSFSVALEPGGYLVDADVPGGPARPLRTWCSEDVFVPTTAEVVITLRPAATVRGHVRWDGTTPSDTVFVLAVPVGPSAGQIPWGQREMSPAAFELRVVGGRARYDVWVRAPGEWETDSAQAWGVARDVAPDGVCEVAVRRAGVIAGRVDPAMQGIKVTATHPDVGGFPMARATSAANGTFRLEGVPSGSLDVQASGRDPPVFTEQRVRAEAGATDVVVPVRAVPWIAGRLVGPPGMLVGIGSVRCTPVPVPPKWPAGGLWSKVATDGTFRIDRVPPGRCSLAWSPLEDAVLDIGEYDAPASDLVVTVRL